MNELEVKGLRVEYDKGEDILYINDRAYSGELFRSGLKETSEGECWKTRVEGRVMEVYVQKHRFN